jgi:hypothetical protein
MIEELERKFSETTKLLFGIELNGIDEHGKWLGRRVPLPYPLYSKVSGKEVWVNPPLSFRKTVFTTKRVVAMADMEKVNISPFKPEDFTNATASVSISDISERLIKPVSYFCGDFRYGEYQNVEKCSGAGGGINLYYGEDLYLKIKNCAYSNYTLYSENMFGCHGSPRSKFCIHVYNSVNVTRCFEVDGCINSSDSYFCHNSESLSNCLFCFNAKSLRYAVGNVEVGPEKFAAVKKVLLGYVAGELRKNKFCEMDIYNVGCWKK